MRVYVAGRFSDYERVRAVIDVALAAGHSITRDWTRTDEFDEDGHPFAKPDVMEQARAAGGDGATVLAGVLSAERLAGIAEEDVEGAGDADLLIALADRPLTGAMIEIGAALRERREVWVYSPWRWTVFWDHPCVTVWLDYDEMLGELGRR